MFRASLIVLAACTGSTTGLLPGEPMDDSPARHGSDSPCAGATDIDGDGVVDQTWVYEYDDRGRSSRDIGHYSTARTDEISEYTWDNLDHLTSWVQTNSPDEKRMEYTVSYDTIGNELEYTFVDLYLDNTQTSYRQSNTDFDEFGHPGHAVVRQTGISDARYTFTYDESGRLIERDRDDGLDGTIDGHATIVYDEQARTATTTTTNTNGSHSLTVKTYDASNHVIEYTTDSVFTDATEHSWDYTYEWSGDRVTADSFVQDGKLVTRDTYRYDCGSARRGLHRLPSRPR